MADKQKKNKIKGTDSTSADAQVLGRTITYQVYLESTTGSQATQEEIDALVKEIKANRPERPTLGAVNS